MSNVRAGDRMKPYSKTSTEDHEEHPVPPVSDNTSAGPERGLLARTVLPLASRPWAVFLIAAAFTALLAAGLPRLRIENDLMYMLPEDNPVRTLYMDFEEVFGNSSGVVIAVSTKEGLFRNEVLSPIRELSERLRRINLRIPAGQFSGLLPLTGPQALAAASYLQWAASDPDFSSKDLKAALEEPAALDIAIQDAMPNFLFLEGAPDLSTQTAQALSRAGRADSGLAESLMDIARQVTDRRGKFANLWVDDVVSLSETDTVWPELVDRSKLHDFFDGLSIPVDESLDRFMDEILERGLQQGMKVRAALEERTGDLEAAGVPPAFQARLRSALSEEAADRFVQLLRSAPKQIRVGDLVRFPEGADLSGLQRHRLQSRLRAWTFFRDALYSEDGKNTLILVRTAPNLDKPNRALLLAEIDRILKEVLGDADLTLYTAGEPVVDEEVANLMSRDVRHLLPIVIAVVSIFLAVAFRTAAGVIYPMLTVLLSVVWCVGLMAFADVPVSIVSTVLPVLLVAVGSAYGIHLIHHFARETSPKASRVSAAGITLDVTGRGVLMAGLTTAAGFGSLAFNRIVPLREFGIFIALGVIAALVISLYLIPALMIRFGVTRKSRELDEPCEGIDPPAGGASRALGKLSDLCTGRPRLIIAAFAAVLLLSLAGLSLLRVEINNIAFFKKGEPVRVADGFINRHFAGTVSIGAILEAPSRNGVLEPDVLRVVEALSQRVRADHPEVGKVLSAVDLIKKMHQAFHYNDPAFYRLPLLEDMEGEASDMALKAQALNYLDKYPRDTWRPFIDEGRQRMRVNIQLKTASSHVSKRIMKDVKALLDGPLGDPLRARNVTCRLTGIGALYLEADHMIVFGQLRSIAVSLVIVFLLVAWVMRSARYGGLAVLPLGVTILINFGLMGFAGIPLDAGTAITACIAIGIGIDYAIHYLNRYRSFREQGLAHRTAARRTSEGSGRAIAINALSVTSGFLVLLVSSFMPLVHLGALISLTMINAALGSLTLIPAILSLGKETGNAREEAAGMSDS